MREHLRKGVKIILWIVTSIILLLLLVILSLNVPAVQNFVKDKAIGYLKKKSNTEVRLETIKIAFPKDVVLNKFYIEDLNKDTLLYAEELKVDISLVKLLSNTIEVNYLSLKNIRANVKRVNPDTTFNFSFLVDAFMSDQKKPDEKVNTDATSTLKFSIEKVDFENIGLTYRDDVAGNNVKFYLGKLETKIKDFDLPNQHYVINSFKVANTSLVYLQQKPLTELAALLSDSIDETNTVQGKLPTVEVRDFSFNNVNVNYDDRLTLTNAIANINKLAFKNLKVDLTNAGYTADDGQLANSFINFVFQPAPTNNVDKVLDTVSNKSMLALNIKNLDLVNNRIQFDNLSAKPLKKGIDFNHLNINGLNLGATNITYSSTGITADVKNGSLTDKSGFVLNTLRGNAMYNDKQINLSNFVLKTPHTSIENATNLTFDSIDDLTKNPERVKIDLALKNTTIGLKDAEFFTNALPAQYKNEKIKVNANLNGYLNSLNIQKLQLTGLKNLQIDVAGKVNYITDVNKAFLDLNIRKIHLSKSDILALAPKNTIPNTIELPNLIDAKGTFKGLMTNFATNLTINTDMGAALVVANMKGSKGREQYNANLKLQNFNVGRLLKQQPTLGRITANASVIGTGLDAKKINAKFNANIIAATYNKYNYRNLNLNGDYANQRAIIKGKMLDSNANFELTANANLAGKYPAVRGDINIKQVDLENLNFSTSEFKFAGKIKADIQTADVDYLNGNIFATNLQLVKDGKKFIMDTVQLNAVSTATENKLTLTSELISAKIDGKYKLSQVRNLVINEINKYYQFGEVTSIPPQRIRFAVNIYNPKYLEDFVPQLTTFLPSRMNGLIDTQKDSLLINAVFPKVTYNNINMDSITLKVNNDAKKLSYKLLIKSIKNPSIALYNTEVSGAAADNKLGLDIFLRDIQNKNKYAVSGFFTSINKDFRFNLDPNNVLLDYKKWNVSPENYIQFGKSGILANRFNLSQGAQALNINSTSNTPNSPLKVEFKNFQIATLTKFAETDTTMVGGEINGFVNVKDLVANPKFEADLKVTKLRYQKDELGNLRALVNNNTTNAFDIDVKLSGVHELAAKGLYYTAPESALDMKVNIQKIDLTAIESVSMGQIKEGKGILTGEITVKGALTEPKILGDLKFNDAGVRIAYINSYFTMPNQQITFTNDDVSFNKFTFIDSLGQKAIVDGDISISNFDNIRFALDIRTRNFRVMNSTAKDNDMIYGNVFLTSNITVRGNSNQPDVRMNVTVDEGTNFYFAMPVNDPSVIDQEGIVQFIDADTPPFNGEKSLKVDSVSKSPIKGINLVAEIKVDPKAELNVVVDPANGDMLSVKGEADLTATIDPSGKISMTGRYEIVEGSYAISIVPLGKRPFKLVKGSTIIWTGEPTDANVDLTALYEVNAAPIDLLNTPDDPTTKTKLPFQVYLYMKGELMKPLISFKIDLPENERGTAVGSLAYTKLQTVNRDENELNKQVFALLALGRFVANNPFQSLAGGGGGLSTMARSSVSKLLTEQLNNLASDLIQGVDLDFGVNSSEDYSSGSLQQKTDLEVGLSKKLLDDRLTVTVGSSFALEGPATANESATNIAGNVNIEYALSKDGKYRLRAYRRNQNESIIEGQIIETGIGFTMVVDYNKFKEIFQSRKKRIKKINEQKPNNEKTY